MRRILKIEIMILLLLTTCALGNVRRVPSDYSTIQAAIDDVNDGDTVLVAPGIYIGDGNRDIEFKGKAITVKSEDGPQTCIIDCNGTEQDPHRGFYFHNSEDANSVLQGFTIIKGYSFEGCGIFCEGASPLIIECLIKDNIAISDGGGIYCSYSSSMILDCLIHNNTASSGGGISCRYSYPTLLRCSISNNTAGSGGGITISYGYSGDSLPTLKNCLITGNKAKIHGGGISSRSYFEILNCTLSGNQAGNEGGGIYFHISGGKQINNSILYGNMSPNGSEIAMELAFGAGGYRPKTFKIANSVVGSGPNDIYMSCCDDYLYGDWLHLDPLFAQPGYWDPNGTPDDLNDDFWVEGDYHLKSQAGRFDPTSGSWVKDDVTSPCIDAGDPNSPIGDEPFPNGGIINMGAYGGTAEASKSYILAKIIYVDDDAPVSSVEDGNGGLNDGSSWENAYVYLQDALADANDSIKPIEIRVAQGIYKPDQGVGIIPGDPNATFQLINGVTLSGGYAGIDANDPNAHDVELYETILSGDLNSNDEPVVDLKTIFDETSRYDNSHNIVTAEYNDKTAVLDGVTVTAGFANDVEHIVFSPGPPGHPNYDYRDPRKHSVGAGLYCYEARAVIANCTFVLNAARKGGGIYNYTGEPNLINCRFVNNTALSYFDYGNSAGGGLYNDSGKPLLTNCEFMGNFASLGAGISDSSSSDMIVTNCTFSENSANYGGGINTNSLSNLSIKNCKFTKNSASELGGGMSCWWSRNLILTNCRFTDNYALGEGGAINSCKGDSQLIDCIFENNYAYIGGGCVIDSDEISFINCAFIGNKALSEGGGLSNSSDYSISNVHLKNCLFTGNSSGWIGGAINFQENNGEILNCTISHNSALFGEGLCFKPIFYRQTNIFKITNSILWGGSKQIYNGNNLKITITYSNIQGGWEGMGNIDEDPLFADPGYWANINDPNIIAEPNDPNAVWIDGDYHLKSQAGKFDPNTQSWVQDDVTSPCIDAGDPNSTVGEEPFPNGGKINMGAYGGSSQASKSYFGEPPCETIITGDINGDCKVDLKDFTLLAAHRLEQK